MDPTKKFLLVALFVFFEIQLLNIFQLTLLNIIEN